ncbi:ribonuclease H-like domain-containing protein [Tanacetum coccineum]
MSLVTPSENSRCELDIRTGVIGSHIVVRREKYEIWARRGNTRYRCWIIIFGGLVQQGNSHPPPPPKRLGKDAKGNTIVHPPVSLDEHVAVQRENKLRLGEKAYKRVMTGFRRFEPVESVQARQYNDDIHLKFLRAFLLRDHDMIYEDFDQGFEKKAGRKMNYNNQQPARFDRRKVRCYKCLQLGHFARVVYVTDSDDKLGFMQAENKTGEVEKVYGMMAGLHADNGGAGVSDAAAEFAMMGISPKAQKEKKEWEVKNKIGLGFKEYFGKDEVFDLSTPSVMYPEPVEEEVKPLYSWFVKAGEMHAVPPSITGTYMPIPYKSDIEETQVNNSDKSSDSETYASCDSSLKTKTKDFPPAVDIKTLPESDVEDPNSTAGSPSFSCLENVKSPRIFFSVPCKSKAASVPAGSRNSSASVTAGGSDPAASRNRPAVNSAAPVIAGRGPVFLAGWLNPAARPYFRPSSVTLGGIKDHIFGGPRVMVDLINLHGCQGDLSTDNDIGIVDSGCSRSMTGNKEKLDDFVQNKVLFTDTDCLVLTEEFQLPDESQVVLRIPRERDLYTFSISELQPEQNVTCLVAKASLDESTRWHRRMAHVNFKTINKLAKEGLVDGLPLKKNQLNKKVKGIRCDNGTEFKNAKLIELCGEKGIKRDYSNPRTPQQNGVAERKNSVYYNPHNKTPYELISGKVPQIGHLKPFGCQVTILNTSDHLGKFEGKADEGYLVGYAPNSKAYRVYNLTNKRVEETMNLRFLEDKPNVQGIDWKLLFFDVATSFDSTVHRVHAVSIDAADLDVVSTVSAACIDAAGSFVLADLIYICCLLCFCCYSILLLRWVGGGGVGILLDASEAVPADYVPADYVPADLI